MIQMTEEVARQIGSADVSYRIPPSKVQSFIDRAEKNGLTITREKDAGQVRSWTITSPSPVDRTAVWLYYTPSNRGGRLGITVYYGPGTMKRNATRLWAGFALDEMGDSLKRHQEREARKLEEEANQLADLHSTSDLEVAITTAQEAGADQRVAVYQRAIEIRTEKFAPIARLSAVQDVTPLADCGCPLNVIADAGHQEGCSVLIEEVARAARLGLTVEQLRVEPDPTLPGWFRQGQIITDRESNTHHQVVTIETDRGGLVTSVAVSTNGGYGGKLHWYGAHPDAVAPLSYLEGPHIGLSEHRPWPATRRAARLGIGHVLTDQKLSGWATDRPDHRGIMVNVPNGVDPTRHLLLLERYVPYPAVITLNWNGMRPRDAYPTILITPRED